MLCCHRVALLISKYGVPSTAVSMAPRLCGAAAARGGASLLVTALAAALAASARPALGAEGDCCSPALLRAFGDASKEFGEEGGALAVGDASGACRSLVRACVKRSASLREAGSRAPREAGRLAGTRGDGHLRRFGRDVTSEPGALFRAVARQPGTPQIACATGNALGPRIETNALLWPKARRRFGAPKSAHIARLLIRHRVSFSGHTPTPT